MTDPRMTPTNDAPVTVEQIKPCPFCASPGKMIHPMGIWAAEYARPGHAGGYGPNGSRIVCTSDECSGCGRAFYGPDQDAEAIAQWNGRLAALASAPAGDGDDEAASAYVAEYVMSTDGADYEPTDWERQLIEDALHGFLSERSLARPRAAVGEQSREAIKLAIASGMGEYIMPGAPYDRAVNAILALQSSPAKVEG